jgi:hypothetical protein
VIDPIRLLFNQAVITREHIEIISGVLRANNGSS